MRVGVGICVQPAFELSFFDCRFEDGFLKKMLLVALSSFSVASAVLLKTCAAKSGEVGYGDCRHECDDEE